MADGFQGFSINSYRKTPIQSPIGFFGFAVVLANAPNTFIQVLNGGKPLRNTLVTALNTTSGTPDSKTTDSNGEVALKADSITDIELSNGVFKQTYSYDLSNDGRQFEINMNVPPLI